MGPQTIKFKYKLELEECYIGSPIVVDNILRRAIQGTTTKDQIKDKVEKAIENIKRAEQKAYELLEISKTCEHDYDKSTYTIQRRLTCYVSVYERHCKHCKFVDSFTQTDDNKTFLPSWSIGTEQRYYNNDF